MNEFKITLSDYGISKFIYKNNTINISDIPLIIKREVLQFRKSFF